jgi:nitrilase
VHTTRADYPAGYNPAQGNDPDTEIIGGGSIVSPGGQILAGPLTGGPGLLVADLGSREIAKGKFDLNVTGHDSRPDIFSLEVNTRTQAR